MRRCEKVVLLGCLTMLLFGIWGCRNAHMAEQAFSTETAVFSILPTMEELAAYPNLKLLDLSSCEAVTPAAVEAISSALPEECRILWNVPLTDGLFLSDSTELTLPHFSKTDAELLPYFPQLARVDVSDSMDIEAVLRLVASDTVKDVIYTIPVGNERLTASDAELHVTGTPEMDFLTRALVAFPELSLLDLREAEVDPEAARELIETYPALTVHYTVPIGSQRFDAEATALALSETGVTTAEEAASALAFFSDLAHVDLHGTALDTDDALILETAFPSVTFSYSVPLYGQMYENSETELDLRETTGEENLVERLRAFRNLKTVLLPESLQNVETVEVLTEAYPEVFFSHPVTVLGQTVLNTAEALDASGALHTEDEVRAAIEALPYLKMLDLCGSGLSNEQMEKLMASYPDVKLVWIVTIGKRKVRTDATGFSTKNPSKYANANSTEEYRQKVRTAVRLYEGDIEDLKYCTDLEALDLGHNYLTNDDLEILRFLPHLKVLILADNKITDISALAVCRELEYVELFMNRIADVSPLVGLEHLIDINICNIHLENAEPLKQFTQAERLWFAMNDLSRSVCAEIADALPECVCNYTTRDETGDGWREHPRYKWMRAYFADS